MRPSTVFSMFRKGKVRIYSAINRLLNSWYRVCFLSAAGECGVLEFLADGPQSPTSIADKLGIAERRHEELTAWLDAGVAAGALKRAETGYALRGFLAKTLSKSNHDEMLAVLIECATLHYKLLLETPERLRRDQLFTLADQDGELVARSSRAAEPLVQEGIRSVVSKSGAIRLLEIGCGSGTHVRFAASLNPELTALALDLQPDVAEMAKENLANWGLAERVTVDAGDVRDRKGDAAFDLATLHNNIYYFPVDKRVELLSHVRGFLKPSGRLLLITGCQGGSRVMHVLSLWGAVTEGCGPLPAPEEMCEQMRQAGFEEVKAKNLGGPFESFYAFVGVNAA